MAGEKFLVILDHRVDAQPALDRALQSVELTQGRLHLFKAAYFEDDFSADSDNDRAAKDKQEILKQAGKQLLALAEQAVDAGVEVSTELVWAKDWGAAVINSVKRHQIFMAFKSSHIHNQVERREDTLELSLLRNCPCPVLLMHDNTRWENRRVLAAVNLAAMDDAHKKLNQKVIDIALTFKAAYDAEVHFVNAASATQKTSPSEDTDEIFAGGNWLASHQPDKKIHLDKAYISQQCGGVDTSLIHLVESPPTDAILNCADEINADLIILGTVARTGIKSQILGNMAEKILDKTACDVLTLSQLENTQNISGVPFA